MHHKCKCGYECVLIEGFEPHELRDFLLQEGVLIDEPVLPHLHSKEDLTGLKEHFEKDGNDGEEDADESDGS